MTHEDVKKVLDKDTGLFYNAKCKYKLPENIMDYFKAALFSVSPKVDNIATSNLKTWILKKPKELNFGEASKMVELIVSVPREKVFVSFDEAMEQLPAMEQLMKSFTEDTNAFNEKLNRKQTALLNMERKQLSKKEIKKSNGVLKSIK